MEYQPGTCNIGDEEQKRRSYIGMAGYLLASAVLTGIIYLDLTMMALIPLFICFTIGFEGYFQTRYQFCPGFAMQGIYDVSKDGDDRQQVSDEDDHRKDVRKAVLIHSYSIVSALAVTVLAWSMLYG